MTVRISTTNYKDSAEGNKVDADVCNGFGCDRIGIIKTELDCGVYGKLEIIVCDKCLSKFETGKN
jgi:hypothetical protein